MHWAPYPAYLSVAMVVVCSSVVAVPNNVPPHDSIRFQQQQQQRMKLDEKLEAQYAFKSPPVLGEVRRYESSLGLLQLLQELNVDLWSATPAYQDVYFPSPDSVPDSLDGYQYTHLPFNVPPIQDSYVQSAQPSWTSESLNITLLNTTFHSSFHSSADISLFLHTLAEAFPELVSVAHYGNSVEGRELEGVKIASPVPVKHGQKERHGFIVLGAQHAREWIAVSTALYLAQALAVDPATQSPEQKPFALRHLLEFFEFHIIPLPNVDGYEYTRTTDRLWYKNRQPVSRGKGRLDCAGIDMNRNWGFEWHPSGESGEDPCGYWFPGTRAYEAIEVNALASYIQHRTGGPGKVAAFLDLRSYGQMLSTPYSYSCDTLPPDAEDLIEAALGAAQASYKIHGNHISTGMLCETLYSAPGNIVDWAYADRGIKYSYAAHLRDTGVYGYLIPEHYIRPTGEETAALVDYLASFIAKDTKTF